MYRRILLAYDGTLEGRNALREGALLARRCGSEVFLLSVAGGAPGVMMAEGAYPGALDEQHRRIKSILDEGVERLRMMGFSPAARLVVGDPSGEIAAFAQEIKADLVVVGHRKRSLLERWWSGASGAYLVDQISCSLLVSRNIISDAEFNAELARTAAAA